MTKIHDLAAITRAFRHFYSPRKLIMVKMKIDSMMDNELYDCMIWQKSIWNEVDQLWWRPIKTEQIDGWAYWMIQTAEPISDGSNT